MDVNSTKMNDIEILLHVLHEELSKHTQLELKVDTNLKAIIAYHNNLFVIAIDAITPGIINTYTRTGLRNTIDISDPKLIDHLVIILKETEKKKHHRLGYRLYER